MKLVETYAANSGLTISKPFIYEKFFPLNVDRYITIHKEVKYPSRKYLYWQEVVDILNPILDQNNIKILQVGTKEDEPLANIMSTLGMTSLNQLAYIIRNTMLHVGVDSFPVHLASSYDKKVVSIYSNTNSNNMGPYWGNKKNHILIEADRKGKKPSYSFDEFPKTINTIKPEEIAKSVLKLLDIPFKNMPTTIKFGEAYSNRSLEIIPDGLINPQSIPIDNPIIRMDYIFNEEVLHAFLQQKKCLIFTDKPINLDLLTAFKGNVAQVVYIVDENNDYKFIKNLKNRGIPYAMISYLDGQKLNQYKMEYMDYGLILEKKYPTKNIENIKDLNYKSSRILVSVKGQFDCKYQWLNNTKDNKVVDNDDFWKDSDSFYIFELDKQ